MKKILFVCHGNICRSPMAEFILKRMVKDQKIEGEFEIASAATSREEIGNPIYPPAVACLKKHQVITAQDPLDYMSKRARQLTESDFAYYDYIIVMDEKNYHNALRIVDEDKNNKICKLMSFVAKDADVADPWYTDDFETAYRDIAEGCEGLLKHICQ